MTTPILTPRAAREQQTFRALLTAMSRPGTVFQLPEETGAAPLQLIAEALVDHEVTFAALPDTPEITDAVLRQTGSRIDAPEEADYVFCQAHTLAEAIERCKEGTPEYPDASATVVCEVEDLADDATGEGAMVLSGPGIRGEARVRVAGLTPEAKKAFQEKNAWPPLGADLVLVERSGRLVCLSRYTKLREEG